MIRFIDLRILKLSIGMFRVFIVLSVIFTFFFGYYSLPIIKQVYLKKDKFLGENYPVELTAISNGYTLIGGGKEVKVTHPERNITVVRGGWGVYICYVDVTKDSLAFPGSEFFIKKIHTNLPAKELVNIATSESFTKCLKKRIRSINIKIIFCYMRLVLLLLLLLIGLYVALLVGKKVIFWVIDGFRKEKE